MTRAQLTCKLTCHRRLKAISNKLLQSTHSQKVDTIMQMLPQFRMHGTPYPCKGKHMNKSLRFGTKLCDIEARKNNNIKNTL
jgi:hypothetical protein